MADGYAIQTTIANPTMPRTAQAYILIWKVYLLKRNLLDERAKLQEDLTSQNATLQRSKSHQCEPPCGLSALFLI